MRAHFLLGPAGSGKTFRCLAEVRAALADDPDGDPLVFLAPKQATFQLERQLLTDGEISGFTRLHIFSFERLARFALEKLDIALPDFLSDEGRVMVLRALLLRHESELKLFSRSARRPGFAQELAVTLNEFQQQQLTPAKLRALAQGKNLRPELRAKLDDLALLHENYSRWLAENKLQDANCLLDFATDALSGGSKAKAPKLKIENLWLDGFAEMTPQELDLIAAIVPFCKSATLSFCLDESGAETADSKKSWLSVWNAAGKSYQQCRQRIENLPDSKTEIEFLPRDSGKNRFAKNPALQLLEKNWQFPSRVDWEKSAACNPQSAISLVVCANAEAESTFAAREVLKFVRAGNRFRDCAVLVRNLDGCHQPIARTFRRYGIPFFLDRRESVAHHPLAELTRSALRTVIFDWSHNDFFAALKAGFCADADGEAEIDRLENAALEFGWRGKKWREPLPDEVLERLRKKILPPFENFYERLVKLKFKPDGKQLAEIFRKLWNDLRVEETLEIWNASDENKPAIHSTVFDQMDSWLENLVLAFPRESLTLRDWLPILESGLANLTVGVIPPAMDQVLIGAIDRARNPDLKLACILGVNESIFPAAPTSPAILTDADRDELGHAVSLGPDLRERISRERYYGYIACTRAGEKLTVTFARQDVAGKTLNPSPFIAQLKQIFPKLETEEFQSEIELAKIESANEIAPKLFQIQDSKSETWPELFQIPALKILSENLRTLREPDPAENLSSPIAEKLHGPVLRTSVSRLEEFAACPFRFFVRSGLRAEERKIFELDARERGNFQHEVLKNFHNGLKKEEKHWRDLTPAEARERIKKIAAELMPGYRDGLLRESAGSQFAAQAMAESLQDFVEVAVFWMRTQYGFDPAAAELDFGTKESPQTAWEINLKNGHKLALRGRIDRVDLGRDENGEDALAVVMDYKSSGKKLDAILVEHGVHLQLLAYLNVLRQWKNPQEIWGAKRLIPAGVFYVNLRGEYKSGGSRDEILADAEESQRRAYRHTGRFDTDALDKLDSAKAADQFNYRLTNAGKIHANSIEALPHTEFEKLLDGVEIRLHEMGERIFAGAAQVDPYRKSQQTPCEFCDYQAACRIDPWTHQYRVLRAATE